MFKNCLIPIGLVVIAVMQVPSHAETIDLITNGDFETGTLAGWVSSGAGSMPQTSIDTPGSTSPSIGFATPSNTHGGDYYAISEDFVGQTALRQTFVVADTSKNYTLSFDLFTRSYAGTTSVHPSGLDYTSSPNQHVRVDLLTGGSGTYSTTTGLLHNFYLGTDGTGGTLTPYTHYEFNITPYFTGAGSYDFRMATVANTSFLGAGIDNVHIRETSAVVATPEPETWAMMGLGMFALAFIGWKRKRGESQAEVSPVLAS